MALLRAISYVGPIRTSLGLFRVILAKILGKMAASRPQRNKLLPWTITLDRDCKVRRSKAQREPRLHDPPFKRKTRVRFPELTPTYHSSFHCIYPSYSSSSDGWGRKMAIPCIGAVLRARKRTSVAVVEFHVSLYPISVSPFFPLCTINMWK